MHDGRVVRSGDRLQNVSAVIASVWDRNLVLDVLEGSTDNGAPIMTWRPNGGANQRFELVPA